jgi:predicted transcriptional regulator
MRFYDISERPEKVPAFPVQPGKDHNIFIVIIKTGWMLGVILMGGEGNRILSEREETLVRRFTDTGVHHHVARVLVFLARAPGAASGDIERGACLRQPAVSIAMKTLRAYGWVQARPATRPGTSRPVVTYTLARPLPEIADAIGKENTDTPETDPAGVRMIREFP